jgi:hypothetical protein
LGLKTSETQIRDLKKSKVSENRISASAGHGEGRFECRTKWTSLNVFYDRFNTRDIEAVLAAPHEDVIWANGMEGGHVNGHDEVRSYWTRQWTMIDPHVDRSRSPTALKGKWLWKSTNSFATSTGIFLRTRWSVTCFESKTA